LCLHNDDHDLHSSAGNMDYSGDQSKDVVWGMRHRRGRRVYATNLKEGVHLQDLGMDGDDVKMGPTK
jgi:hypothetical protein